jgi:hypothetical protein
MGSSLVPAETKPEDILVKNEVVGLQTRRYSGEGVSPIDRRRGVAELDCFGGETVKANARLPYGDRCPRLPG